MESEIPKRRRLLPRGSVLAWIACSLWAAYWIAEEVGAPPPEELPAWLRESVPYEAWELPVLLVGALVLAGLAAHALRRGVRSRVRPSRRGSEAFAEAAAVWILLDLAVRAASARGFGDTWGLLTWAAVPFAIAGVGLFWPVFLGVDGRRSQVALGLSRGRGVAREAAIGLLAVPAVLAIQALWTVLVRPDPGRPNPIDEWLYDGDATARAYAVFALAVQAPVVEECAFRGLLHRFFRDATRLLPTAAGVGATVIATSCLFALAHPYGWIGVVPILLFGAAAALLREWRGSLVAPIALHAGMNAYLLLWDVLEGGL